MDVFGVVSLSLLLCFIGAGWDLDLHRNEQSDGAGNSDALGYRNTGTDIGGGCSLPLLQIEQAGDAGHAE